MRVDFVIQKLAGIRGGAERIAVETAAAMAERGHDVTLVTFEPNRGPPAYETGGLRVLNLFPGVSAGGPRRAAAAGGPRPHRSRIEAWIKRIPNVFPLAGIKWAATHGLFAACLRRHLRRRKPEVVVGVMRPAITAAAFAARGTGIRVIASTHNVPAADYDSPDRWDRNPIYHRRSREAFRHCERILVLLEEFRDWFLPELQPRVVVMPNPLARLTPPAAETRRRKVILGVGRLTAVKRFDLLVAAWQRIAAGYPDWSVEICGEGPEAAALRAQIDAAGLGSSVRLCGACADMGRRYDEAAVLCHPATFEGFGLAVGEALAHGVPAVAFADCPGVNRLIRDGDNGVLVAAGEDRAGVLAVALDRLVSSEPLRRRLGAAGPASVAPFAPDRIHDRWDRLLRGS